MCCLAASLSHFSYIIDLQGRRQASRTRPPPDDLITPDPSATDTGGESSIVPDTDTGSEFSASFNEVIDDLHSLRRGGHGEDDDQSTITETSSVDDGEGVVIGRSNKDGSEIRQRRE